LKDPVAGVLGSTFLYHIIHSNCCQSYIDNRTCRSILHIVIAKYILHQHILIVDGSIHFYLTLFDVKNLHLV